jgi:hypothetical protein
MMTGGNPDPYVIISVLEDEETSAIKTALSNLGKIKNLMSSFNGMSVEGDLKKQILSRVCIYIYICMHIGYICILVLKHVYTYIYIHT